MHEMSSTRYKLNDKIAMQNVTLEQLGTTMRTL